MHWEILAKVHKESKEGTYIHVLIPKKRLAKELNKLSGGNTLTGELIINDKRLITSEQRKKTHALIQDIAKWSGDDPEIIKEFIKYDYMIESGEDSFSLSNCSVVTARSFINYLIDFALKEGIPLMDTAINRTDDVNAAIYSSLKHKKCIVCGRDGEVHHWDAVGMGRDRTSFDDGKTRKLCLCRTHHTEAHRIGKGTFESKYHVYGIVFNE